MRKDITIAATPRETRGKNEARRLRVRGLAPAVVYGNASEPVAVSVNPKDVSGILRSTSGHNTIFNLDIQGQVSPVMFVDWQHDPIKGRLLHIDMKRIDMQKKMLVKIPVHATGEPRGVKIQGGLQEIVNREVEIECLPDDIPESFTVDVTELLLGQSIRAGDLPVTGSMRLVSPAEAVISHIVSVKAEAAAEETAAAVPEPEVVKKGKKEEPAADDKDKDKGKKK